MHARTWTATALAAGLSFATAVPALASDTTSVRAVEWSTEFETASASGQRWTEPTNNGVTRDLIVNGTLANTGDACYALWTQFVYDLAPGPMRKQAEICGPGSVPVDVRQPYMSTTTGYVMICKGTASTDECSPRESITWWPISTS
ncbi:hypothetical protein [Streptomyces sp. NPDC090029]|uniref:hypothetical protein n=1 Tax=Streptomyces sp. NPDC090029 TaxID=3365924 RepID=UPI0038176E21